MRRIKNIAVLGSGVMGSGIACHLANAGFEVLMLDMSSDGADKNQIANTALNRALKSSPAPLYSKKFRNRIHTGNFDDDLSRIKNVDWVIEVVKEDLNIKRLIFNKIDAVRKPGTIITSNTSGIPVSLMVEGMSDDFKKHFCITHFFNPPRYLALLEIIPGTDTDPEIIEFLMVFGNKILGKRTVLGKDTPAFIANRIGVFSMGKAFQLTKELGLTIQSVDKLTGVAIGRPKTGTFRLGDLVGLDTAMAVLNGIRRNCPDDALAGDGEIPEFFARLIENNWLGDKTGRGFYQKTGEKDAKGKPVILGYNLNTFEYEADPGQKLESLDTSKQIDDPEKRIRVLFDYKDAGGLFVRKSLAYTFIYAALRIPEIADNLYSIDDAMRAGFAWDYGPFQYWDIVGLDKGIEAIRELGLEVPEWVVLMKESGNTTFYRNDAGIISFYDPNSRSYKALPGAEKSIQLNLLADQKVVYKNDEIRLWDIGDDVLCLEFTSKMNAIGGGILNGIQDAITLAEEGNWRGIVIGNNSKNFTVGANLMMIAMLAYEQEFDQLNMAVDLFQKTTMRCRYSKIPVVAATQGYVFGGGCEMVMHCDATAVAAESYIGLVEVGVGLLPGGGGTKEFAVRASDSFFEGDVQIPRLIERFKTIAMASVATSAVEAYDLGYLNEKDFIVMYQPEAIYRAKQKVIQLSGDYVPPIERDDILVLGRTGLGALYAAAHSLKLGNYASDHDILIAKKIAYVLCGGDLSSPQNVSEQYLLDIEREAFLSLCGEQKTLERISHMLEKGKPLRN
ncbi:MAG TPA: 3-hydroxyacyl-CoA dehydrogenase NAD-binding domain-containing protein [Saprospiraceae bacterium]|jgi:3-hydroxyacyl-CoA dehydrogenase|nr:3-hydroxyacyl-CoA dehydrogenase NAD-binding domain-containing protein [Saprospiraceae bacterium]HQN56714.1 3-hydroxyacyl-CoA dehydrogenase NAD-binding domain-containing protein [Saprospiraceae bacterium]HRN34471.1 3-hydroxyacyl-CoA dehydrogenase NAD-binding domain-containing protein [Saprospiraceae bacterium]HRP83523.1 3-hydroxyacyl-CoA dehydrogenase NAD-binding domain-containing protein [Saprospiraceae bacterium]